MKTVPTELDHPLYFRIAAVVDLMEDLVFEQNFEAHGEALARIFFSQKRIISSLPSLSSETRPYTETTNDGNDVPS